MDEWRSLPSDDQATYLIGLIVRSSADLDAMTRTLWPDLMMRPRQSAYEAPRPMGPRLDAMRGALPRHELIDTAELADGLLLLEDVRSTYERRNRFVHDILLPADQADGNWWSVDELHRSDGNIRPPQGRVNLDEIRRCERELVRATWRAWGLYKLIVVLRSDPAAHERRRWHVLVRGEFELHRNEISYSH